MSKESIDKSRLRNKLQGNLTIYVDFPGNCDVRIESNVNSHTLWQERTLIIEFSSTHPSYDYYLKLHNKWTVTWNNASTFEKLAVVINHNNETKSIFHNCIIIELQINSDKFRATYNFSECEVKKNK